MCPQPLAVPIPGPLLLPRPGLHRTVGEGERADLPPRSLRGGAWSALRGSANQRRGWFEWRRDSQWELGALACPAPFLYIRALPWAAAWNLGGFCVWPGSRSRCVWLGGVRRIGLWDGEVNGWREGTQTGGGFKRAGGVRRWGKRVGGWGGIGAGVKNWGAEIEGGLCRGGDGEQWGRKE